MKSGHKHKHKQQYQCKHQHHHSSPAFVCDVFDTSIIVDRPIIRVSEEKSLQKAYHYQVPQLEIFLIHAFQNYDHL